MTDAPRPDTAVTSHTDTSRRRSPRSRLTVGLAVLAALAAGCSSATDDTSQPARSTPSATVEEDTAPSSGAPSTAPSVDDREAWRAKITACTVDANGFARIEGEVANDSSRTRSYTVFIVLDGQGALRAGSGQANASSVASGAVGTFTFTTSVSSSSGGISDCRIDRVSVQ